MEAKQFMPSTDHCVGSHTEPAGADSAAAMLSEPWRSWANLLHCGALTPSLLSTLALAVGAAGLLVAPAQADKASKPATRLAAVNNVGPAVAILSPTNADELRGRTQIRISIKGTRYPAQMLEMLVDGRLATPAGGVPLDATMLPTSVFNWDTKLFADGPHVLSVVVTDSQGFKGTADVKIYINNRGEDDIIPPTVKWLNVRNGDVLTGEFPVQVDAADNRAVKWVIIALNPSIAPAMKPPLRSAFANIPPYVLNLKTQDLPAGRYSLSASAYDFRDNIGLAERLEVLIGVPYNPAQAQRVPPIPPIPSGPTPKLPGNGPSGEEGNANSGGQSRTVGGNPSPGGTNLQSGQPDIPTNPIKPEIATGPNAPRALFGPQLNIASPGNNVEKTNLMPGTSPLGHTKREGSKLVNLASLPSSAQRIDQATSQISRATQRPEGRSSLPAEANTVRAGQGHAPRIAFGNPSVPTIENRSVASQTAMPNAGSLTRPATIPETVTSPAPELTTQRGPGHLTARSSQPMPEMRVAAMQTPSQGSAANTARVEGPQVSHVGQTASSIAQREVPSVKLPVNAAPKIASIPPALKRELAQEQRATNPQLTRLTGAASGISRSFPDAKPRPLYTPKLATLPGGAPTYPDYPAIPSPNLTSMQGANTVITAPDVPAGQSSSKLPQLPPTLPKIGTVPPKSAKIGSPSMAMLPQMPGDNNARPLAAITVAPISEWGTQAATLPASHTVRRDETLTSIARRYQMPVAVLAAANNLKTTSHVRQGAKLDIPQALQVTYGGLPVKADAPSFMMGSVGVTPFRFLFEKQGGKLEWDAKNHRVMAKGPQGDITLSIGSRSATVNDKEAMMDLAAFLMSGRTMVPVRFFEQALHARVEWDPSTGRLYVATASPAAIIPMGGNAG